MADLKKQTAAEVYDRLIEIEQLQREVNFLIERINRCLEIAAEEKHILPERIKNILIRSVNTVLARKV